MRNFLCHPRRIAALCCRQPTPVADIVVAASNIIDQGDGVVQEDLDNGNVNFNDSLGSLCARMENLAMKDETLMSPMIDDRAAIRSPVWPASPGESPVPAASKRASTTPPRPIGCKIPSLRPSPGSLVMAGTPPSAKRSQSRGGLRSRSRVAQSRLLSTRTGAASDIITQPVSIGLDNKPPRSAKKKKQRRFR